jgi:hypothetical protein
MYNLYIYMDNSWKPVRMGEKCISFWLIMWSTDKHAKIIKLCMSFADWFFSLGVWVLNQNDIHDEIKSTLNAGNTFYHSDQNLLSSRLI